MEKISFDMSRYQNNSGKRYSSQEWQDYAAKLADYLKARDKRSSIFQLVKKNRQKAQAIHRYMEEKGITNVYYFLKVWENQEQKKEKPEKTEKRWLCSTCSKTKDHFLLAGIRQKCELCGHYAHSYYESRAGHWVPSELSAGGWV